ncbi:DIS3-like exonuclease 2 [Caerostris extrusa]|uniref:DIS3-like exonuclease 2 n=1 Tax=Caerostris extrusa TaxID=172846 RepID=A0AAV4SCB6_CAEEX|nr:DIS3-like exonuclease 2 [Caerostris extrusa]
MEDTITNESSKATMANAPNRTFKIQSTGVENLVTELETLDSKARFKIRAIHTTFQVQQGLKRGEFIEGALRINPRNYEDAYVSSPDGKMDIYIGGMQDRNRALAGDIVVVQINPKQEWKVLCDAIKDYEEKSGEIIADTVCMPIPSPPCKVHTPDKLLKSSRPQSSNSWGSNFEEHGPDTLKILGIDKLAKQLGVFSIDQKKSPKQKSKPKSKLCKPSKENQGQSGASYSQESSEDCLDKMSPNLEHTPHEQNNFKQASNLNPLTSENCNDLSSLTTECTDVMYPACDMNKIGTFNLEVEKDSNTSKAWEGEESSLSIIISPEELLNIDGNSLLQHNVIYDNEGSDSEFNGIIVPLILEDSAFLACQQDADNNNVVLSNNVTDVLIDQFNNIDLQGLASKSSVTSTERYLERDCRVQHVNSFPSLQPVEINSESVVCSVISEVQLSKIGSSSDENVDADPLIIGHFNDLSKNINEQVTTTENKKKSKHRRRKKKQDKKEVVKSNANEKSIGVGNLTVDEIMKHPKWSNFIQRTGKIVHILERKHSRIAAGHLKIFPDKNTNWALFSPNDSRVPRIMVPMSDCPENFYHRSQDYANVLFLAEIVDWNETSTFAAGKLLKCLGNTGDVEVETEGILLENSVKFDEFPNEVLDCLPQEKEWHIPLQEIKTRKDFRNQCIFTIDPATARDMDDAVSCTFLQNGNFEVGVHIADVTYFVEEGSELDLFAKDRSTSVYLVQKVVPMLPRLLCDNLCSLNPGQDRLTFSIIWEMTPQGDICKQWIGRSIINSCSKLSYEHAQSMLENPGLEHWNVSEFPEVYGGFTINDIAISVYHLHCLALQLRERRFDNGALRLDQVKLQFTLDAESGLPSGFNVFVHKDSK